ncbi:hypothetical protein V6N13_053836 [Hibiscus sabdariffa]
MATSSIVFTNSLLLTCVALVLVLLPACTEARFFPTVGSRCKGLISMVTDLGNKIPKSPPSPKAAPSKHQGTNDEPENQASASVSQLESRVFNSGKMPKSPPSPNPAPSRHQATNGKPAPPSERQGTIEQPTHESWLTSDFQFNSVAADLGKTGWSPPSPMPALRIGQEIIEQPIQQSVKSKCINPRK